MMRPRALDVPPHKPSARDAAPQKQQPSPRDAPPPQKQPSPRVGLRHLRTSSSDSDPLHHRPPITEKSPRLAPPDRRSPRGGGARSDPAGQRKLGTRISDLETQLVQAQRELKTLKNQLGTTTAESVVKKEAQEDKKDKRNHHHHQQQQQRKQNPSREAQLRKSSGGGVGGGGVESCEVDEVSKETDVFEVVPVEKPTVEHQPKFDEIKELNGDDGRGNNNHVTAEDPTLVESSSTHPPPPQPPAPEFDKPVTDKSDAAAAAAAAAFQTSNEIDQLKSKLAETEKQRDELSQQNDTLKNQLNDAASEINAAKTSEVETSTKLSQAEKELEESKAANASLREGIKDLEVAKQELEAEMKKLRVQTEQWRKAADAAATVLAGDVEIGGGTAGATARVSARCGSMEKQQQSSFGGMPELPPIMGVGRYSVGYNIGSPGDEFDDGFGTAKRKGSGGGGGIRMFGDLWRKKGQK